MLLLRRMAVLNEIVWRNFLRGRLGQLQVFGILPLTLIFAMSQIGLIKRYEPKAEV
jgi:intracellular septation protein